MARLAVVLLLLPVACATPRHDTISALSSGDAAVRTEAIEAAAGLGAAAVPELLALLADEDGATRSSARQALTRLARYASREEGSRNAVTLALLAGLRENPSLAATDRAHLLRTAGASADDRESVRAIAAFLDHPELRDSALFALARIPHAEADLVLIDRLARESGAARRTVIQALGARRSQRAVSPLLVLAERGVEPLECGAALARIGDARAEDALYEMFQRGNARARSSWLLYLEHRAGLFDPGAGKHYDEILASADQPPHARVAALVGLERLRVPGLFVRHLKALSDPSPVVRRFSRAALIAWPAEDAGAELAAELAGADATLRSEILRVLTAREDARALGLVLEATESSLTAVASTAFELLGSFHDIAAEERLLRAAGVPDATIRRTVGASLNRCAERCLGAGETDRARAMLHSVLEHSADEAVLCTALDGVARVADPASLDLVERVADRRALREPGARARLALAKKLDDEERAIAILEKVFRTSGNRGTRRGALQALRKRGVDTSSYAKRSGFLPRWHILGGFPRAEAKNLGQHPFGVAGPDVGVAFEVRGEQKKWRLRESDHVEGTLDLRFLRPRTNCAAYAVCDVEWPADAEMMLKIGSDDGVAVWLNGELVHENFGTRGVKVDQDEVKVRFRRGPNRILLKINQGGGEWGFCVRVADAAGKPVDLTR